MTEREEHATCACCGHVPPSELPPVSWSMGVTNGRQIWTCMRCTRENLRLVESRIDVSAWSVVGYGPPRREQLRVSVQVHAGAVADRF